MTDAPRRHRRVVDRPRRVCPHCLRHYLPIRSDQRWCSQNCRQRAYLSRRRHFALVTWTPYGQRQSHFKFFETAEQAYAHAPKSRPWTVVDIAMPVTPHESVAELLQTRFLENPYPFRKWRAEGSRYAHPL